MVTASFEPPTPGVYYLSLGWERTIESGALLATEPHHTAFVTVTYDEDLSACTRGPFRTRSGLTLCLRDGQVIAWDAQGARRSSFPASDLMVRGDSVWTWGLDTPDEVELRDGTLTLRGSGLVGRGGRTTEDEASGLVATDAGVVFRTLQKDAQGVHLSEADEPWPTSTASGVVTREGSQWWENSCLVTATTRRCLRPPFDLRANWLVEADAAWVVGGLQLVPRPFSDETANRTPFLPLVGKAPVTQNVSVVQRGGQAPGFLLDGHFLVPRRAGLSPVVRSVPVTGTVLSHTREFLVTQPEPNDPFTLRIFFMEP